MEYALLYRDSSQSYSVIARDYGDEQWFVVLEDVDKDIAKTYIRGAMLP